jgi:hypothetical protein
MAFIENAQMVDPKFVINTLNPMSKEKSIMTKGEISPNMTKLRIHVRISGNGNAFNKQKYGIRRSKVIRAAGTTGRTRMKSTKTQLYTFLWLYPPR